MKFFMFILFTLISMKIYAVPTQTGPTTSTAPKPARSCQIAGAEPWWTFTNPDCFTIMNKNTCNATQGSWILSCSCKGNCAGACVTSNPTFTGARGFCRWENNVCKRPVNNDAYTKTCTRTCSGLTVGGTCS